MGRKERNVWKYFIRYKRANAVHGRCKFCGQTYFSNASRMEKHITKCHKTPDKIKRMYLDSKNDSNSDLSQDLDSVQELDVLDDVSEASTSALTNSSNLSKKPKISHFLDHMDDKENLILDTMLARAMFASSTPNQFIENPYVQSFLNRLRPSYKIPSRYHNISTSLLNKEYNLLRTLVKKKIVHCESMALISDGWTDVNGTSLINIIFTTPEPIFYRAIDSKTESHTGEYIAYVLGKAIEEVEPKKVGAVITDNARNMKCAWNILKHKYPHIVTYGCVAHGLNLLSKDILSIPSISRLCAQVKDIIKFFRNKQAARQALKEIQLSNLNKEIQLLTFSETRWGSMSNSLESLIKNKYFLQNALFSKYVKPLIESNMKRLILDEDIFWPKVAKVLKIVKPIAEIITKVETDKPGLSNLCTEIEKLQRDVKESSVFLNKPERDSIELSLENRCKNFIQHNVQFAANLLNPLEIGKNLSEENQNEAIDFIADFAEKYLLDSVKVLSDLANYRAKSGVWARQTFWKSAETIDSLTWWRGFFPNRELTKVAIKILSFPATAASAERNWKTYSNIHTKKRNKLTIDRAMKLVYVKFNLELFKDDLKESIMKMKYLEENVLEETWPQHLENENTKSTADENETENLSESDEDFTIYDDNMEDTREETEEAQFEFDDLIDDHNEQLIHEPDETNTVLQYINEDCNIASDVAESEEIESRSEAKAPNLKKIIYLNTPGKVLVLDNTCNH